MNYSILIISGILVYLLLKKSQWKEPDTWFQRPAGSQPMLPPVMAEFEVKIMSYRKYMMKWGIELGIEPAVIASIIGRESLGEANQVTTESNGAIAYGLMQILGDTLTMLGFDGKPSEALDPETNIKYGTQYLNYQFQRYRTSRDMIAAFNSGTVKRKSNGTYVNQDYVDTVVKNVSKYRLFFRYYYCNYKNVVTLAVDIQ